MERLCKVNISLTAAQIAALDTLARERTLSRASLIRQLVVDYLKEQQHDAEDKRD